MRAIHSEMNENAQCIAPRTNDAPSFRWCRNDLLIVAIASLLSHLYTGIHYGLWAHATQLPTVFRLMESGVYPGDLFVDSLEQYCSWYWIAVAWLSRIVDTQGVLVASHLLSRFLLLAAVYELTGRMCAEKTVRFVVVIIMMLRLQAVLADEVLYSALPTHTTFTFPWLVWGLVMAWRGRPVTARSRTRWSSAPSRRSRTATVPTSPPAWTTATPSTPR